MGLCLLVGAVGGSFTSVSVRTWYPTLVAPPLTPPPWVFAPVWTTLYGMIGVSAWLVWRRRGASPALRLWGWQLAANALWTPAFFGLQSPALALVIILALVILLVMTIRAFHRISVLAAGLLLPYLAWTIFATYLTTGFWWLNPG